MNPLQQNQLKLSFKHYYDHNNNNFVNVDELKRANQILSRTSPNPQSNKIFSHIIRNRKHSHQGYTDQVIHYQDFENRINQFISQQQKNDHTTIQLIFQLLDKDKDGLLNIDDLMNFLKSVGSNMDQKQIIELLELMTPQGISLTKKQFQFIFSHI